MPVLSTTAYANCETVLNRVRMILNDSEVQGGDVLTDSAPFTFSLLNAAYERVQIALAEVGAETYTTETWLIGLPSMPSVDPEARLIVDDAGTHIVYPNGAGDSDQQNPQLPPDLILPVKLWERQNGTSNFTGPPMKQVNDGLLNLEQQTFLVDWEWRDDGLRFRGALQVQDVKLRYEKQLPLLVATTDPVPIRGVTNAAAYHAAKIFCESRGGMVAPVYRQTADEEIQLLRSVSARRRQRKQVRRKPYSGRWGRGQQPII